MLDGMLYAVYSLTLQLADVGLELTFVLDGMLNAVYSLTLQLADVGLELTFVLDI